MTKGEIAENEQFLLLSHMFSVIIPSFKEISDSFNSMLLKLYAVVVCGKGIKESSASKAAKEKVVTPGNLN